MVAILREVIEDVAARGNCVIVGRGSPYILREHPDAFHVFVYAPTDEKIRRVKSLGKTEREAAQLVSEVDAERASFIRHYFGKEWPCRALYNMMLNSKFGDEYVIEAILQQIAALEKLPQLQTVRA
jgi:cytidylate kinase